MFKFVINEFSALINRRTFLKTGLAPLAVIPAFASCSRGSEKFERILSTPASLAGICDSTTIRKIGEAYLRMNNQSKSDLLRGLPAPASEDEAEKGLALAMQKRIQDDFQNGNIMRIEGWILSETEAKQCALFSMISQ